MLNRIDRYVLRQVMVPLVASLGIGLSMLLAERLVRLLDTTLGKRNSFISAFELLAYLVPHYLGTAIPAALFLGLLFGFNKLSKSNELDAMLAAGIGLHRLARPAFLLSLVFSVVALGVFGWLQPYTRYAYRSTLYEITSIDAFFLAEEGVFMQSDSRTFILDELDRDNSTFTRIFLFDDPEDGSFETLTSERGQLIPVPEQSRPVLRLFDGHRLLIPKSSPNSKSSEPLNATAGEYRTLDTPLGKVGRDIFRKRGADERELSLYELFTWKEKLPRKTSLNSMRAELHRRVVYILAMMVLPFLALPFAVGRPRNPRAYRIAIALALLVCFHEIIQQGALATERSGLSPWLTMWLPLSLLVGFAFWRFYRVSFHVGSDSFDRMVAPIHAVVQFVAGRLFNNKVKP